jgi:hypothetical protein
MSNKSILRTSGQVWKLVIAIAALLLGSVLPAFSATGLSWTAGTILSIAGYAFGVLLIRCPACGARWFWDALMHAEIYKAVLTKPECPACRQLVGNSVD